MALVFVVITYSFYYFFYCIQINEIRSQKSTRLTSASSLWVKLTNPGRSFV